MAKKNSAISGSERYPVEGARVVGDVHPDERIRLSIRVRRRSGPDFDAFALKMTSTPPRERPQISRADFAEQFGADPADMSKIEAFARSNNLSIIESNPARRTVIIEGAAEQLQKLFDVELKHYASNRGAYRGRVGPVNIPAAIAPVVEGVFGFDNRRQARPHFVLLDSATSAAKALSPPPTFTPPDLGRLYNFPEGLDGSGQCIGILEFGGGFTKSDLTSYFSKLGVPAPNVTVVSVDGAANSPGAEEDIEVLLDIEVAAALAPKAKIVVYFAPFTEQGWVDVLTTAVHDEANKPSVISISWGFAEGKLIWTQTAIDHVNEVLKEAAALNLTVCVASGDDGSADDQTDGKVHVDFPASSPFVLACGGTSIESNGHSITSEIVWNRGPRSLNGGASGGGVSERFGVPAYQASAKIPISVKTKKRGRGVPDVSAVAEGYLIHVHGKDRAVGGTSAVAPLWAALFARINQKLKKSVGFVNPTIYTSASSPAFRDIVSGTNDTNGKFGGYVASSGWDACTGLGSPDGAKLLAKL